MSYYRTVYGFYLAIGGKAVCWDSFNSVWFLGPRSLSEVFPGLPPLTARRINRSTSRLLEVLDLFPSARPRYVWNKRSKRQCKKICKIYNW